MPSVGSTPTTSSPALQLQLPILQQQSLPQQQQQGQQHHNVPQQHPKLQQQHSLPLQIQYHSQQSNSSTHHHNAYQQHHNHHNYSHHSVHHSVTTTQPSPAGTFITSTSTISAMMDYHSGDVDDLSPVSSSNSFSSVDTNQTLLNAIMTHQQQHQHKSQTKTEQEKYHSKQCVNGNRSSSTSNTTNTATTHASTNNTSISNSNNGASTSNRSYHTKYGQFMIITPAVAIDRDYNSTKNDNDVTNVGGKGRSNNKRVLKPEPELDDSYFNNGNIFRMSLLQSSIDSGNSSDSSSFRSNYNPYLHTSRQHLLPKSAPHFYTFSSWRWCTLICAAMRCFGGGHSGGSSGTGGGIGSINTQAYSSFSRPPYQRSKSSGTGHKTSSVPHRKLRTSSSFTAETAFEHFSAPFKPRKTRDHLNNITYEL